MSTAAQESALERQVREEQEDHEAALAGEDAEKGKLFEVPRVGVILDDSDPTLLKVAFAGGIEIERSDGRWINFYNNLRAGNSAQLTVAVHVAGAKTVHRRDSEGDVDAVVQTKSLVITDILLG